MSKTEATAKGRWGTQPLDPVKASIRLSQTLPPKFDGSISHYFSNNLFDAMDRPDFEGRILPQVERFSKALGGIGNRELARHGYSISFEPVYDYRGVTKKYKDMIPRAFEGSHLVIRDRRGADVGVIGFRIGWPTEVTYVVGREGAPEFYNKTGRHFYQALMDALLHTAGAHMKAGRGEPLVRVNHMALWQMKEPATREGFIEHYYPPGERRMILRKFKRMEFISPELLKIKPEIMSSVRRRMARSGKILKTFKQVPAKTKRR